MEVAGNRWFRPVIAMRWMRDGRVLPSVAQGRAA